MPFNAACRRDANRVVIPDRIEAVGIGAMLSRFVFSRTAAVVELFGTSTMAISSKLLSVLIPLRMCTYASDLVFGGRRANSGWTRARSSGEGVLSPDTLSVRS